MHKFYSTFIALAVAAPAFFGVGGIASPAGAAGAPNSAAVTLPVNLRSAGYFVILSQSGITDVFPSVVTGNIGTSPITGAANHLSCSEVTGSIFSVNAAGPAPCSFMGASKLSVAVNDMHTAYTDAAGRHATVNELGAGNIGGRVLAPGVYKWTTGVSILTNVTLNGGPNAIWIFQISQNLYLANAKWVLLTGGAQPRNIFWQVAGEATFGTTSHFEGIVLAKTAIHLNTGATMRGRLFAQTAVTLQKSTINRLL